jgi:hypothetical protein
MMKRILKWAGLGLLAGLIVIQFFPPEKNMAPTDPAEDFLMIASPSQDLTELIKNSCYDCHSNQTAYPWYSRVAPVSFYLDKHIRKGKEDLNLSEYGSMGKADKIKVLNDLYEVVEAGTMPLISYSLIHKAARLSEEDKEAIMSWSEREALKVMRE